MNSLSQKAGASPLPDLEVFLRFKVESHLTDSLKVDFIYLSG
jgi:hypothetical protein